MSPESSMLADLDKPEVLAGIFPATVPANKSLVAKQQREFAEAVAAGFLAQGKTHAAIIRLPQGPRYLPEKTERQLRALAKAAPPTGYGHLLKLSVAAVGGWRLAQMKASLTSLRTKPADMHTVLAGLYEAFDRKTSPLSNGELEVIVEACADVFATPQMRAAFDALPDLTKASWITILGSFFNHSRPRTFAKIVDDIASIGAALFPRLGDAHFLNAAALYPAVFSVQWTLMTDYLQSQFRIAETAVRPFADYSRKFAATHFARRDKPATSGKPKLAYLIQNSILDKTYANGRALYSLAKGHHALASGQFDFYYYNFEQYAPEVLAEVQSLGFNVRIVPAAGPLDQAAALRRAIEQDDISVLITESYAWLPLSIFAGRAAPVQMYLSCGFIKWEFDEVDSYLMFNNLMDGVEKWNLPAGKIAPINYPLELKFLNPPVAPEAVAAARAKWPQDAVVMGTLCRMEKVSEPFLNAVAAILEKNPQAIYVVHGPNSRDAVEAFAKTRGHSARLIAQPATDPHIAGHTFDLFLDTFPICGGMACVEAQAKGVPVVHLKSRELESMASQRDPALISDTVDGYIEIANALLADPGALQAARERAPSIVAQVTDTVLSARQVEEEALRRLRALGS
ncbi:MAG: hypothetical protein KDE14_04355 [Rhodobacteraceae bacterium]|nr:hypothetical protein [Paracoccaceae bacterium]